MKIRFQHIRLATNYSIYTFLILLEASFNFHLHWFVFKHLKTAETYNFHCEYINYEYLMCGARFLLFKSFLYYLSNCTSFTLGDVYIHFYKTLSSQVEQVKRYSGILSYPSAFSFCEEMWCFLYYAILCSCFKSSRFSCVNNI